MKKTVQLSVLHRRVTFYEHPRTGYVHGMVNVPRQMQAPVGITEKSHMARVSVHEGNPRTGKVVLFPVSATNDVPLGKARNIFHQHITPVKLTGTNIFVKLSPDIIRALGVSKQSHMINWYSYTDKSLDAEIFAAPAEKV